MRFSSLTVKPDLVFRVVITIPGEHISAVNEATAHFTATVTDPKAQIITTYSVIAGQVDKTRDTLTPVEGLLMTRFPPQATVSQLLFYDAPSPPAGIFDAFLTIPFSTKDICTRSFISLVQASNNTANAR